MWRVGAEIWVFEPTLREVEYISRLFAHVTWIGFDHGTRPDRSARSTVRGNIRFLLLPCARGGKALWQKLKIVRHLPGIFAIVVRQILLHTHVHTRAPSVPALFAICVSYFDLYRTYWHKYAGNWVQRPLPWAYALQRFLLRHGPHTVTVNGIWPGEPANVISLENPCLTEDELAIANGHAAGRTDSGQISLCFVGALVAAKGVHQLMDALSFIKQKQRVNHVFFAGNGSERVALEFKAQALGVPVSFLGSLAREELNRVYQVADVIVLPSATEGFPKVIAEAAAFGCVPIVTNISAIGQYVKHGKNGLLLSVPDPVLIAEAIDSILDGTYDLSKLRKQTVLSSSQFTYEQFVAKIKVKLNID